MALRRPARSDAKLFWMSKGREDGNDGESLVLDQMQTGAPQQTAGREEGPYIHPESQLLNLESCIRPSSFLL